MSSTLMEFKKVILPIRRNCAIFNVYERKLVAKAFSMIVEEVKDYISYMALENTQSGP